MSLIFEIKQFNHDRGYPTTTLSDDIDIAFGTLRKSALFFVFGNEIEEERIEFNYLVISDNKNLWIVKSEYEKARLMLKAHKEGKLKSSIVSRVKYFINKFTKKYCQTDE